jgi:hypothetical protein
VTEALTCLGKRQTDVADPRENLFLRLSDS